jgi:hypothetical protein
MPSTRTLFAEGSPYATLLGPSEIELRPFSFPDSQRPVLLNNHRCRRPQEPDTTPLPYACQFLCLPVISPCDSPPHLR